MNYTYVIIAVVAFLIGVLWFTKESMTVSKEAYMISEYSKELQNKDQLSYTNLKSKFNHIDPVIFHNLRKNLSPEEVQRVLDNF